MSHEEEKEGQTDRQIMLRRRQQAVLRPRDAADRYLLSANPPHAAAAGEWDSETVAYVKVLDRSSGVVMTLSKPFSYRSILLGTS